MSKKQIIGAGKELEVAPHRKSDYYVLLRAIALLAIFFLGAYIAFFRLGVTEWHVDEITYRDAGLEYVRDNDFSANLEHPFLVKYILGVTQVMLHSSEAQEVRIPAATAALLTGLLLFALAWRVAGYWTGVLALALWTISPLILQYGRIAILESFLAFFSTLALYLGWRWAQSCTWVFAAFAGVAIGLATASKPVGILFLPPILFAGLLKIGISRRFVLQSILVGLVAATTALATYAPLGSEAPSAIQYMFDFQSTHNAEGHPTKVGDEVYSFPPWWTLLLRQWEFYGPLATLSMGAAVVIALLRHRPVELYLLAAILSPLLFLSFYVNFKIDHYIYAWQPPLILLLALAAARFARREIIGRIFAILLLVPFVYLGVETVQAVRHVQPGPYAVVAEHLEATGHDGDTMLIWGRRYVLEEYLPEARIRNKPAEVQGEEVEVVFVDSSVSERRPNRPLESYLATNRDRFEVSKTIDDIEVYTRKPDG